jgi:hypothetical protein
VAGLQLPLGSIAARRGARFGERLGDRRVGGRVGGRSRFRRGLRRGRGARARRARQQALSTELGQVLPTVLGDRPVALAISPRLASGCRARRRPARSLSSVAVAVALAGLTLLACALLLVAVAAGLSARHWTRLAGRAAVGARSEAEVRRALAALEREGWRLRHALLWHRVDVDHVAVAPTGIAFAIETKTRRYEPRHLDSVRAQAAWLRRRRRRWCSERRLCRAVPDPRPAT